ncbi:hypothetical protein [Rhodanobacter sp. L36]|uniref:hypothetical protein n=1 Tax=Rhodanobacter sp. L36 TaxID=1747221 RepID=UPI00131C6B70|nr:hypothetical protein [Rhodanobacter sp. L36]
MARLKEKRYEQHLMVAMSIYVAVMLLVWPLVAKVGSVPLKWLLALAPTLPMLYVIWLMAQRIRDSDELEQRMHLVALGVATAVVGVLSLMGGFLAASGVLAIDGRILIWVFPVMMASYGITRWRVARAYNSDMSCDGDSGIPMHWRLAFVAAALGAVGIFALLRRDAFDAGMFAGMAGAFIALALAKLVAFLRRRRDAESGRGDAR